MSARVTAIAADNAANTTSRARLVTLDGLMPRDTGLPSADAEFDFSRARRRRALAPPVRPPQARRRREPHPARSRRSPGARRVGERRLGEQLISLDSIVGTVDRAREFDRAFRPTSPRVRERWERINLAQRSGEAMPPIDVYRIGDLHFVKDGHHRVSVAHALGLPGHQRLRDRGATQVGADHRSASGTSPLKSHERLFFDRVPLPPDARSAST